MLDIAPQLAAAAVLLIALSFGIRTHRSKTNRYCKLPPGPPGLPLLGSLLDVPGKVCSLFLFCKVVASKSILLAYGNLLQKTAP